MLQNHSSSRTAFHSDIQWIPLNRDRFLQLKRSRLTENPLYPKSCFYCYLVNGFLIQIPINRKSPLTESRLTGIYCILTEEGGWQSLMGAVTGGDIEREGCSTCVQDTFFESRKRSPERGVQDSSLTHQHPLVLHLHSRCLHLNDVCSSHSTPKTKHFPSKQSVPTWQISSSSPHKGLGELVPPP